jgi:hypothetical protein
MARENFFWKAGAFGWSIAIELAKCIQLLGPLPERRRNFVTATSLHWTEDEDEGPIFELHDGNVRPK